MSYSLISGQQVGTANHNGRCRPATGDKSPERTGWELVAWALLEQAIDDTKILCGYGLINKEGELRPWPRAPYVDAYGYQRYAPMTIAMMRDPNEHSRLRDFWLDPSQAQHWCDLCGCKLPAKDIWNGILRHHAQ